MTEGTLTSAANVGSQGEPWAGTSVDEALAPPGVTLVFANTPMSFPGAAALTQTVPGFDRFPWRALLLARARDIVCVNYLPEEEHLRFLAELGLGCERENIVVACRGDDSDAGKALPERLLGNPAAFERLVELARRAEGDLRLQPHLAARKEFELAGALEKASGRKVHVLGGDAELVLRAYLKHTVRAKAVELGVPVAPGEVVELQVREDGTPADLAPVRRALERHARRTGRAIVRGTCGTSGSSCLVAEGSEEGIGRTLEALAARSDNSIYLVEEMFEILTSPNIQIFVDPDARTVRCVSAADQRLDGELGYRGNAFPSRAETLPEMIEAALEVGRWLAGEGFTGLAGYDFVEYRDPATGRPRQVLSELNPRINGASYAAVLMERFNERARQGRGAPVGVFLSAKFKLTPRSFADLRRRYGHLFFDPATGRGLVPYNIGWLEFGMFRAVFLGRTPEDVEALHADFEALLSRE